MINNIQQIISRIITILILVGILNWINKIEKCKCAKILLQDIKFLKYSCLILIIFNLLLFIPIFLFQDKITKDINNIINDNLFSTIIIIIGMISIVISILSLIFFIKLLNFIVKLQKIDCDCGLSKVTKIIHYYSIIVCIFITIFTVVYSIILLNGYFK